MERNGGVKNRLQTRKLAAPSSRHRAHEATKVAAFQLSSHDIVRAKIGHDRCALLNYLRDRRNFAADISAQEVGNMRSTSHKVDCFMRRPITDCEIFGKYEIIIIVATHGGNFV